MDTWITAHSGADGTPENSLDFLHYALSTKADALEIDVRRNQAGILVLSHDTAEDHALPLLDAFHIAAQHPTMKINCDLKENGLEIPVYQLAENMGLTQRLLFSGTVAPAYLPAAIKSRVLWNIEEQIPDLYDRCQQDPRYTLTAAEKMCIRCKQAGIDTINAYEGLISDEFLAILKHHRILLSVWTVNEEARLAYFLSRGVFNVTTRCVKRAIQLKGER